jgi:hypothetical protein
MSDEPAAPNLIVHAGTQVVTRGETKTAPGQPPRPRGAVGRIVTAPSDATHAYRVLFADGGEVALSRGEFAILKHYQRGELSESVGPEEELERYRPYIIYRCIVGSRAYGLDREASDLDMRGCFLPPADLQ